MKQRVETRDGKTFVVTTLPDDPQASEQAARERTLDQSGEHKQRAKKYAGRFKKRKGKRGS